jgi:8-oxo-dGTP pyrophosphatase MutT (NUDIX family)
MLKVGLVVWRDGALLTVRKEGLDDFILPGGKPEPADADERHTLERELLEELGGRVDADTLQWMGVFTDQAAGDPTREIELHLYRGELNGALRPAAEVVEYRWFDPKSDDLELLAPSIRNSVLPVVLASG